MIEGQRASQEAIYDDIADAAEDLHRVVAVLAIYPPEVAAMVVRAALKGGPIQGKRRRRLCGFVCNEVKALRTSKAEGNTITFEEGAAEPGREAA